MKSGYKCVTYDKKPNREYWVARVRIGTDKTFYIGSFPYTPQGAAEANRAVIKFKSKHKQHEKSKQHRR
jgi:hypothetical protein